MHTYTHYTNIVIFDEFSVPNIIIINFYVHRYTHSKDIHTYIHTCIHTCMCAHTHTYIHTCIHAVWQLFRGVGFHNIHVRLPTTKLYLQKTFYRRVSNRRTHCSHITVGKRLNGITLTGISLLNWHKSLSWTSPRLQSSFTQAHQLNPPWTQEQFYSTHSMLHKLSLKKHQPLWLCMYSVQVRIVVLY